MSEPRDACLFASEDGAGQRILNLLSWIPQGLVPWRDVWSTLLQAEQSLENGDIVAARHEYQQISPIPSLARLYAQGGGLLAMGRWEELVQYVRSLTAESAGKPSLHFSRLLIIALAASGRAEEVRESYQNFKKHFPAGSVGRGLLLVRFFKWWILTTLHITSRSLQSM